jgi:pimeloyl-ACP methyl ester carboxylesterase
MEGSMARQRTIGAARSFNTFGIFKDHETDWLFKRTLAYMNVRCAETGECLEAARRIDERDAESWIKTWADLAARVEAQGEESLAGGHRMSARDSFLRSMNYWRSAEYACAPRHPRFTELWRKSVACMGKALPLFERPLRRVEVPVGGRMLPGYFWRPDLSNATRPTIIVAGGTDSSLEEMLMSGGYQAVERGYNYFTFDFPGHRGAVHTYPDCIRRPDYEVPFKEAIDYLETLPGVDERLALAGFSYGGYVAARVAIHEKRLKAVIPDSPIIDLPELGAVLWRAARGVPRPILNRVMERRLRGSPITKNFMKYTAWLCGMNDVTLADVVHIDYARYNIRSQISGITCPTLALAGEGEGDVMIKQAREYYEGVSSTRKKLHVFSLDRDGSDDHCQLDNTTRAMQVMFDWLDDVMDVSRTP